MIRHITFALSLVACSAPQAPNSSTTTLYPVRLVLPQAPTTTIVEPVDSTLAPAVRLDPPLVFQLVDPVEPSVESIIRWIWPDDLEERALRIAYRESRYECCVHTWCCYGVFQIHRDHLPWLCGLGLACTTADLYDPLINTKSAYQLYLRDGWAPWAT